MICMGSVRKYIFLKNFISRIEKKEKVIEKVFIHMTFKKLSANFKEMGCNLQVKFWVEYWAP